MRGDSMAFSAMQIDLFKSLTPFKIWGSCSPSLVCTHRLDEIKREALRVTSPPPPKAKPLGSLEILVKPIALRGAGAKHWATIEAHVRALGQVATVGRSS